MLTCALCFYPLKNEIKAETHTSQAYIRGHGVCVCVHNRRVKSSDVSLVPLSCQDY